MAHDPKREDYLRLSLRYALELDATDAASAARAFATFGRRFARERDSPVRRRSGLPPGGPCHQNR